MQQDYLCNRVSRLSLLQELKTKYKTTQNFNFNIISSYLNQENCKQNETLNIIYKKFNDFKTQFSNEFKKISSENIDTEKMYKATLDIIKDNPNYYIDIQTKVKKTLNEKYNVNNAFQLEISKNNKQQTTFIKNCDNINDDNIKFISKNYTALIATTYLIYMLILIIKENQTINQYYM